MQDYRSPSSLYYSIDHNPSKSKIPKTCIRVSTSKNPPSARPRFPLKERSIHTNAKTINIFLPATETECTERLLEQCRAEITRKNAMLARKIQEKQQRIEQLRASYRKIQRSCSKDNQQQRNKQTLIRSPTHQQTPMKSVSSLSILSTNLSKFKLFSPVVLP